MYEKANGSNKAGVMKASKLNIVGAKEEKKKLRKIQDPNFPKRPVNRFMSFSMENRKTVMTELRQSGEGRGAKGQVTKKLAQMWAEADSETRKKHINIGINNKIIYQKEKKEYVNKEDKFEVEELLRKREGQDGPEYEVKWKGFEDPTWEPVKHLEGSKNLMKRFNAREKKILKMKKNVKNGPTEAPKPSGPPGPAGFGH